MQLPKILACCWRESMFLRSQRRIQDGYDCMEESRRLQSGRVVQRGVLYLGESKHGQQAAWRKTWEVFDEQPQGYTTLSLFAEDRPVPAEAVDRVQVKLSEMKLRRAPAASTPADLARSASCARWRTRQGGCPH
jgi:hypothetical protein